MTWREFVIRLLATFAGGLALCAGLTGLADPYGTLGHGLLGPHAIMDTNQRFQYPAVMRSGRFDSIVVGTSTSRLLKPSDLEAVFGGRFANLSMDSGTAWEQHRLAQFFTAHVRQPRTLVVGIDHVWCDPAADAKRITPRGFPEWMYDESRINDLAYMLNKTALEIAGRRFAHAAGMMKVRIPFDGYEVFVPPEQDYDLGRARQKIYGGATPPAVVDTNRGVEPAASHAGYTFPALDWLDRMTEPNQRWQRIVFVMTPPHVSALPTRGTPHGDQEAACKAGIAAIARRKGIAFIDFRRASAITVADDNFWDHLHYRVPIAKRIVAGMAAALAGETSPTREWVLATPAGP
ncbi:MAG: hypothetical protein KGP27_00815 [Hyphomicrobiales bacterium]|nr:hypothetical protein [Hyphomicrobiales bacterium]